MNVTRLWFTIGVKGWLLQIYPPIQRHGSVDSCSPLTRSNQAEILAFCRVLTCALSILERSEFGTDLVALCCGYILHSHTIAQRGGEFWVLVRNFVTSAHRNHSRFWDGWVQEASVSTPWRRQTGLLCQRGVRNMTARKQENDPCVSTLRQQECRSVKTHADAAAVLWKSWLGTRVISPSNRRKREIYSPILKQYAMHFSGVFFSLSDTFVPERRRLFLSSS